MLRPADGLAITLAQQCGQIAEFAMAPDKEVEELRLAGPARAVRIASGTVYFSWPHLCVGPHF
jgi:hypothetical protein